MKDSWLLVLIAAGLLVASCSLKVTDNEEKGIKEIIAAYGGNCKYRVGASASTEHGRKKYFKLELSKSEVVDKLAEVPQMPSSNMAYLFYKNLNREERDNYDEIRTVLIFTDGREKDFKYPVRDLELFDRRMNVAEKVVGLIKKKNFEALWPMISDTSILASDKSEFVKRLRYAEAQFGNVTEGFRSYGFRIFKSMSGRERLHISGVIIRDKLNNEFSVDLDLNGTDDRIYKLDYQQ
jgi:hypothetical protein